MGKRKITDHVLRKKKSHITSCISVSKEIDSEDGTTSIAKRKKGEKLCI